ncbi:MAG: Hsp20/alpha crystallin family protein [Sandaracinaceae bacterium]
MELHNHDASSELSHGRGSALTEDEASVRRDETRTAYRQVTPRVDILEGADEMRLVFDLPGVVEADVDLRVERGDLSLSAEDPARARVYRRAFSLPETIDAHAVTAELDAGVLRVSLGKRSEAKPRRIAVRTAG